MMTRAKRICTLIFKVNKLFSVSLSRCFLKEILRKHVFSHSPCFYRGIETLVKVWKNSKKLWKLSPAAHVPTAVLVFPNFHSCFYDSIETDNMLSISLILHDAIFCTSPTGKNIQMLGVRANVSEGVDEGKRQ